jgi:hypothetical protein
MIGARAAPRGWTGSDVKNTAAAPVPQPSPPALEMAEWIVVHAAFTLNAPIP